MIDVFFCYVVFKLNQYCFTHFGTETNYFLCGCPDYKQGHNISISNRQAYKYSTLKI